MAGNHNGINATVQNVSFLFQSCKLSMTVLHVIFVIAEIFVHIVSLTVQLGLLIAFLII